MAHPIVVPAGRVQTWKKKTVKQHAFSSVWDKLSNRNSIDYTVPGSSQRMVPTTVVQAVSDEFKEGVQKTTCLWTARPQFKPIAGPNPAEGNERKLTTKTKTISYNVQRFPIAIRDRSVGGDLGKYYALADKAADSIIDLFVESTDYDHERALCEGSDEWLTETEYWQDSVYGSEIDAPDIKVLHPNMYTEATTGKVTWSPTYVTAETNLQAAVVSFAATDTFDVNSLDRIHLIASRTVSPLGGLNGSTAVKWVLLLSDAQWYDLTASVGTGSFRDLMKYQNTGFEKWYDGDVGLYKGMLVVVSQRSPIYKASATAGSRFQYVTSASDNRVRSVTSGAGNTNGSAEIAKLLGLGAIGLAEIEQIDYVKKGFDYDFSEGMTGTRARGTTRMDFDSGTGSVTSARINESSFLYFTATSSVTIN